MPPTVRRLAVPEAHFMIDSIVGIFVAAMVSGLIYIVAHDYWGFADESI